MALTDESARIVSNDQVGPRLWLLTLNSPTIAAAVKQGQFIHLALPSTEAHILRRPFSVYDANPSEGTLVVLYQEVGFGSKFMTTLLPGSSLNCIGPIGRNWEAPSAAQRVLLVGGGVGAAPLFMFCKHLHESGIDVDVILGAATKDALVTLDKYTELLGCAPRVATDDGSFGHHGFCTQLVDDALKNSNYDFIACCGPEPLMKIVAGKASAAQLPCQVSMERRMACGIGACLSCVVDTTQGKKRACVDGPIFDAQEVVW